MHWKNLPFHIRILLHTTYIPHISTPLTLRNISQPGGNTEAFSLEHLYRRRGGTDPLLDLFGATLQRSLLEAEARGRSNKKAGRYELQA